MKFKQNRNKVKNTIILSTRFDTSGENPISIINRVFKNIFSYTPRVKVLKSESSFHTSYVDYELPLPPLQSYNYASFAKKLDTEFRKHEIKNSAKLV